MNSSATPTDIKLDEMTALRMGQAQRVLEQLLTRHMKPYELVSECLKISARYYLPIRCFDMLESWARRTSM